MIIDADAKPSFAENPNWLENLQSTVLSEYMCRHVHDILWLLSPMQNISLTQSNLPETAIDRLQQSNRTP